MRNPNYDVIESRRARLDISHELLAGMARVPYTRLYYILAGQLKPDEIARLNKALEAAERERGY